MVLFGTFLAGAESTEMPLDSEQTEMGESCGDNASSSKEYGDRASTEEGEGTELRVWAGDRESTLTSPSVQVLLVSTEFHGGMSMSKSRTGPAWA